MSKIVESVLIVAVVFIMYLVARAKKPNGETFASDGGPAGGLLIGGSYVGHAMDNAVSPCVRVAPSSFAGSLVGVGDPNFDKIEHASKESFNVREWDERANFTPNPHPLRELPYGHDMMGIRRRFIIDGEAYL